MKEKIINRSVYTIADWRESWGSSHPTVKLFWKLEERESHEVCLYPEFNLTVLSEI